MRIARVRVNGKTSTAIIQGRRANLVAGGVFGTLQPTGESHPLSAVTFLPPTKPTKILAIGINYKSHAGERTAPTEPQAFLKAPSSIIGPDEAIVLPPGWTNVHMEAEVVAVIGKRARAISEAQVDAHVFGYTAGNDVSGRDWQQADLQWWRAKSSDTFTAVGPWIDTSLKPEQIEVAGFISGRKQQESDTSLLIHSIRKCIAHVSQYITLERGDLVYTGTPGQTGAIVPGDVCEVRVGGMTLRNPVRER
ncbi:MAG: 2-hydroxyhepta-2,4-diene-1,7-dioate isomerase [Chloroflexota bacterium]